jgi:hypothetical protein
MQEAITSSLKQIAERFDRLEEKADRDKQQMIEKQFELQLELRGIQACENNLKLYNAKIEAYNEKINKRIDTDLHLFSLQVAEL